ncbi:MBL fold metallo-hydrolase [Streptomyces sp. NPDC053560]|uniref:MBL fold metallo-hydrolase n=1 Tax=Streptomyces sp. NPDC053560 TaxID=3365711 RepID=UPI0037D02381
MRTTKYAHACVLLEKDGRVLVIDPGTWCEPAALTGADAVLVTHEHTDTSMSCGWPASASRSMPLPSRTYRGWR